MATFEKEVALLLNGIPLDDMNYIEKSIAKMLLEQGILKIVDGIYQTRIN